MLLEKFSDLTYLLIIPIEALFGIIALILTYNENLNSKKSMKIITLIVKNYFMIIY